MLTNQAASGVAGRLVELIRWIAVRGIAAAVAGILVLGVGGRLVMLASRLLHPDALRKLTENGNRIGEFTVDGTVGLVIFGGLLGGVAAGGIWVLVKQWMPASPWVVGLGATAVGGFNLVQAENPDFVVLGDPRLDLVMLLGLIFAFGVVLALVDRRLEGRLPEVRTVASAVGYTLLVGFGAPIAVVGLGSFTSAFCFCARPPIWTGVFIWLTGLVTVVWWVMRLRGADEPPPGLRMAGSIFLALAAIAGTIYLTVDIFEIL